MEETKVQPRKNERLRENPQFIHIDKVREYRRELFDRFVCQDLDLQDVIVSSLLVRNSRVLLTGNPEAGKTTLVRLLAKGLSKSSKAASNSNGPLYAKTTGAPEQTLQKVISTTNVSKLITKGEEEIIVRPIVTAPIKFINEINRFSKAVQDAFLSLLEEGEVEYGGNLFTTPDFICFADMNPYRGKIDLALKTRFMVSLFLPFVDLKGDLEILDEMFFSGKETRDLAETMPAILSIDEVRDIWDDVAKVKVPEHVKAFLSVLFSAFKVCKHDKSAIIPGYLRTICQKCEFSNEICAHLKRIPGERASIAGILFMRARAWLHHRQKATIEDAEWVAPWVLAHRIKLTAAVRSDVTNPWKWCREAVETLIKTKWYYSHQGEENYGNWAKGIALVTFALDWSMLPMFKKIIRQFYPRLTRKDRVDGKFEAIRKLRDLAFGTGEGDRGDLVLKELYKLARTDFEDRSKQIVEELRPKIEHILADENATLEEVLNAFQQLQKTLPEESEHLRKKLRTKLEKLTVRVSLTFPGRTQEAKELLEELNFSEGEIKELLGERRLKIQNENARVRASGEFLVFRAINPNTANKIRKKFW